MNTPCMSDEEINSRLGALGVDKAKSAFYIKRVNKFEPELRAVFEDCLRDGIPREFCFAGRTLKRVMDHTNSVPPYSYIFFDNMMKDFEYMALFGEMDFSEE